MADTELVENIVASLEGSKEYIYIVGQTLSTSPSNTFCSAPLGNGDAFLAKYDANGKVVWIRYLGGSGTSDDSMVSAHYDWGYALAVDKAPNGKPRIYVGGTTVRSNEQISCSDSYCTEGVYQPSPADGWDGFVAKYDGNGNLMRYTYLGGGDVARTDTDEVLCIQIYNHQVYVAGYMEGRSHSLLKPQHVNATYDSSYNGGGDGYIAIFDTCLSNLNYFSYFNAAVDVDDSLQSPSGQDRIHGMKIGSDGAIYLNGTTDSDAGISTKAESVRGGNLDDFVSRWVLKEGGVYRPSWSIYQGGAGRERARMLALDPDNNLFVCGITHSDSSSFKTIGSNIQSTSGGSPDAFLAKLDTAGTVKWRTYVGGYGPDYPNGIGCRRSSDGLHQYIALTGLTKNCDFFSSKNYAPFPGATFNGKPAGNCNPTDTSDIKNDAFLLLVNDPDYGADTSMSIFYGTYLGGSKGETYGPSSVFTGYGPSMCFGKNGTVYTAFSTASKDVGDASHGNAGKIKSKFHGEFDAVIQKLPVSSPLKNGPVTNEPGHVLPTSQIVAYPAPFTETLTIKTNYAEDPGHLKLFSITGQFIASLGSPEAGQNQLTIDLSYLTNGVYLLQYLCDDKVSVIKIIKQ